MTKTPERAAFSLQAVAPGVLSINPSPVPVQTPREALLIDFLTCCTLEGEERLTTLSELILSYGDFAVEQFVGRPVEELEAELAALKARRPKTRAELFLDDATAALDDPAYGARRTYSDGPDDLELTFPDGSRLFLMDGEWGEGAYPAGVLVKRREARRKARKTQPATN